MKKIALLFSLAAALAVSAPVVAEARHGGDDPSVELRHGSGHRATDDRRGRVSRISAARVVERRGGTDDPAGDDHGGHGGDDGPRHR